MAKKNNKTFAYRAKQLISKYKRAEHDPVERAELDSALQSLADEQELYKRVNGIGEYASNEFGNGIEDVNVYGKNLSYPLQPLGQLARTSNPVGSDLAVMPSSQELMTRNITNNFSNTLPSNNTLEPYQTSIVPSLVGAGTEIAGNLYLANRAKKMADKNQLTAPTLQANTIDLSRARESARRDYGTAANIAKRNLRTAGSRGAYLSGTGAAITGLTKAKEGAISGLYSKEADYNANARTNIANQNAQLGYQTDVYNLQNRLRNDADQQAYLSSAIGAIPQTMRDINATRQQDAMINVLGEDYGIYSDPNRKWYQAPRYRKMLNTNVTG